VQGEKFGLLLFSPPLLKGTGVWEVAAWPAPFPRKPDPLRSAEAVSPTSGLFFFPLPFSVSRKRSSAVFHAARLLVELQSLFLGAARKYIFFLLLPFFFLFLKRMAEDVSRSRSLSPLFPLSCEVSPPSHLILRRRRGGGGFFFFFFSLTWAGHRPADRIFLLGLIFQAATLKIQGPCRSSSFPFFLLQLQEDKAVGAAAAGSFYHDDILLRDDVAGGR